MSLNSIMVDGTGMCGGCRVLVGGEAKFACVDGPEFDAHQVDFEVLTQRNAIVSQCRAPSTAKIRIRSAPRRGAPLQTNAVSSSNMRNCAMKDS